MFQMATSFGVRGAVLERMQARSLPFGRFGEAFAGFRAHSSLRAHVQESFAHHPDVGQRKQRHQIGSVLGQSAGLHLDVAELALYDLKRMFHLGSDARFGLLQLVQDGSHGRVFLY